MSRPDHSQDSPARRQVRLGICLLLASLVFILAGLAAGSDGWASLPALWQQWAGGESSQVVTQIRAPRTLGAWLTGALLGLAGATAQGLFRNPLADPYLLGAASGASLGVVCLLAAGSAIGGSSATLLDTAGLLGRLGLSGAAFGGAALGMLATLLLARGAGQTTRLLLSGVIVGVLLAAAGDLLTVAAPEALRGRQVFLLGSTGYIGWPGCGLLAAGLAVALPVAWRLARTLDALVLGDDTAASLGLDLPRLRLALVAVVALGTGLAVAQAGLIAFVGLVAPHLVRRFAPAPHGFTLIASAAAGGLLLLIGDVLARSLLAPQEVPVGVLTALLGGGYLLWLLRRRSFE